jgi:Dockerin type I domain
VSSFVWDLGLKVSAETRLVEYVPDKDRYLMWIDDNANKVHLYYAADSNKLCMYVVAVGMPIIDKCAIVSTDEWNGTDGLYHELSFELIGDEITGYRDDEILFGVQDDLLLNMAQSGFIRLTGLSNYICFDNVTVISLEDNTYICGDANNDETVNVSDAVHLVNYIFVVNSPGPDPQDSGDTNCDGVVNVSDAVWIINFIFTGGKQPCDTDGDEIPDCGM